MLTRLYKFFLTHKLFLSIISLSLLLRLINLTLLPVFNDEAIYLDWGWRETHNVGFLFYSLYDAKQPLLMWIFGIAQSIFPDPLLAGRLVSVGCGLISIIGLFLLGKTVWNRRVGYIASLLYATSPLFVFFDRQALMESAIASVGIWALYFLVKLSHKPLIQYAFLLGLTLGIGYLIKTTALIFIGATGVVFALLLFLQKQKEELAGSFIIIFLTIFICEIPLFIHQMFWDTVSSNARFSLTLSEILQFPFTTWSTNFVAFIATNIFFITPFVFLAALSGIFTTLRKATNAQLIVVLWLLLSIGAQIMFTRNSSIRYLISYLPLVLIFASVFVIHLSTRLQRWSLGILLSIPLLCSFWQIFAPVGYILSLSKFTSLSPTEYVRGTTSGYGLEEVLRFINDHAASGEIHVAVAENSGNPESALQMYYQNSSKVMVLYMDHKLLGDAVDQYDCLDTGFPTYFISREDQQAGLNKFLVKIKSISNPYSTNTLGIYQLVSTCTGKVGKMRLVK